MAKKSTSLAHFINRRITVIYLITLAISIVTGVLFGLIVLVYNISSLQAREDALREIKLISDMTASVRQFVNDELRGPLLEKQQPLVAGVSGTVASIHVAERFSRTHPDYYIGLLSDRPLNPDNSAKGSSLALLEQLRADASLQRLEQVGEVDQREMLLVAQPVRSSGACLSCHGPRASAFEPVQQRYFGPDGYDYQTGQMVGVLVIGVPTQRLMETSVERTLLVLGLLTILFAIIVSSMNTTIRSHVINPILRINNRTMAVSRGQIDKKFETERTDEIGQLIGSIELLRRSLKLAMDKLRKN